MKPRTVDFYIQEGKKKINEGNISEALDVFEQGLKENINNGRLLFWVGRAALQNENFNKAETVLLQLLERQPKHLNGLKKLSIVYQKQLKWRKARATLNKILNVHPKENEWVASRMKTCLKHIKLNLSDKRYKSFIFTHIQKTGGSSIRKYLAKAAANSGIDTKRHYIPGLNGVEANNNLIMLHEPELEKVRKKQPIILADHSHYDPAQIFKIPSLIDPFYYVMLREPIARVKSHYYFQYYNQKNSEFYQTHINDLNEGDLDKVLKLISNYHIVYLTGYDFWNKGYQTNEAIFEEACKNLEQKYHCFGIFEQMDRSIEILKKRAPKWLKLKGELPQKNKSVDAKDEAVLSERVVKRIEELNKWDIEFYDFAKRLFESRYMKPKSKPMKKKNLPENTALPGGRFYFNPQYKTDKFESGLMHEYLNVLQGLRYQPIKLLEIGVAEGGSVNYFSDYFQHPEAQIIGMDYQKPMQNPGFRENINFLVGDQNDPKRLNEIGTKFGLFDVIIDDGAHTVKETRHTYDCLFQYVKPGGYFIIEDWAAEFLDSEKYGGMVDLMLELYRENVGTKSNEITLKLGHGLSYLMIRNSRF